MSKLICAFLFSITLINSITSSVLNLCTVEKITEDKFSEMINYRNYTTSIFLGENQYFVNVTCKIDHLEKHDINTSPTNELKIVEYNIDKNGYNGDSPLEKGHIAIGEAFLKFKEIENPDVIVLIEVGRNCFEYGGINFAEYLAELLNMNFYYSVENLYYQSNLDESILKEFKNFVFEENECSVGNAILTNRKVVNFDVKYFKTNCCGYSGLYNIKNFLSVDLEIELLSETTNDNIKRLIRLTGTHLEAGQSTIKDTVNGALTRLSQITEIVKYNDKIKSNYNDFIITGDFNTPFMVYDPFLYPIYHTYNYNDAFSNLCYFCRNTCPWSTTGKYNFGNLDYMFSNNHDNFKESVILNEKSKHAYFYGLSDHHPIYSKYGLK